MNTLVTAGALAPVARYAPEYSRAVGRYLLAAAVNSQMFLADGLPLALQDDKEYVAQTGITALVYEGVRNRSVKDALRDRGYQRRGPDGHKLQLLLRRAYRAVVRDA